MTYRDAVSLDRGSWRGSHHWLIMAFLLLQDTLHVFQSYAQGARLHPVSMTATQSEDGLLHHTTYWWLLL